MRVVSPLLKRVVYPCLAGVGYFRSPRQSGLAVVTYHGVLPPDYRRIDPGLDGSLLDADAFRGQLRRLKANYDVISPEDMLAWCGEESELPARAALITCDDGLHSNVTQMLPILQEEGLRCLFFVTGASTGEVSSLLWYQRLFLLLLRAPAGRFRLVTADLEASGVLGSVNSRRALCWDMVKRLSRVGAEARVRFLSEADAYFRSRGTTTACDRAFDEEIQRHFGLMTRADLLQIAAAGMTIGAHTLSHPVLSEQPAELAWNEIVEGRNLLESVLGRKVWAFAYPFGGSDSVSPEVFAMLRQSNFAAAFTNIGGGLGVDFPLYAIPRVHVNADMTLAEFEAHVSGFHERLQRGFGRASSNPVPVDVDSKYAVAIQEPASKKQHAV